MLTALAIDAVHVDPADPASDLTPEYLGQNWREGQAVLMGAGSGRLLGSLSGYRVGQTNPITATAAQWQLGVCGGIIDTRFTGTGTAYLWALNNNPTKLSGDLVPRDAANARVDCLYLVVDDNALDNSGKAAPRVVYVAGVADGQLARPAGPTGSFRLGDLNVPKVGGGDITTTMNPTYVVAAGGIVPASGDSIGTTPYVGQYRDHPTLGLQRWDGAQWVRPVNGVVGFAELSVPGGGVVQAGSPALTLFTYNVPVIAGRYYEVNLYATATQVTADATIARCSVVAGGQFKLSHAFYQPLAAGASAVGTLVRGFKATATTTLAFTVTGLTNAAGLRFADGDVTFTVKDLGA